MVVQPYSISRKWGRTGRWRTYWAARLQTLHNLMRTLRSNRPERINPLVWSMINPVSSLVSNLVSTLFVLSYVFFTLLVINPVRSLVCLTRGWYGRCWMRGWMGRWRAHVTTRLKTLHNLMRTWKSKLFLHKRFLESFCESQFPHESVNLFFILVIVKDRLMDMWGG